MSSSTDPESEIPQEQQHVSVIPALHSKASACWFNYGNIVAMLIPLPLGILWFGASMVLYAINRHHPNERVGHYTQIAAYRFYGVMGAAIVVGTFFGTNWKAWLVTWIIAAAIVIPLSILDLKRIHCEPWCDVHIDPDGDHFDESKENEETP